MDWKSFFRKMTIIIWMLCLINLLVLIVRYTASDIGTFFSWDYPLIWAFILGCIFVFWRFSGPRKINKSMKKVKVH